jgi:hypothetical protein
MPNGDFSLSHTYFSLTASTTTSRFYAMKSLSVEWLDPGMTSNIGAAGTVDPIVPEIHTVVLSPYI